MRKVEKRKYVSKRHPYSISQITSTSKYKDGKWKTYVIVDGKRKEILKSTEDLVYEALYEFYKSLEEAPKTLSDVCDMLTDRKLEKLNRDYKTVLHDKRYLSYISEELRNTPISEITEDDIRAWIVSDYLKRKPKEEALRKMLQFLNQLFRLGQKKHLCSANPAEYIGVEDYLKDCDISKKTDEEKAFSDKELILIKQDIMNKTSDPRSLMTLLSSETGLRAGELSALLKTDIKADGFIHVHRQQKLDVSSGHQEFFDVEYTKDERRHPHDGRYVPITPDCQKALDLAAKLPGDSLYVFHDKKGNPISKSSYIQNLRRRCQRLNIRTTNNHGFRMAFNTRLINMGFSPSDRALILGHAVETNERNYSLTDRRRLDLIRERMQ